MTERSSREIWSEIESAVKTEEEKRCIGEAEDNANVSSEEDGGYERFSEKWYDMAIITYEFLMDSGHYA